MEAWGRWKLRLASRTDQPRGTRTVRPGYEIEMSRLRLRSSKLRTARAPNAAPIMEKYPISSALCQYAMPERSAA